ncbi:MAG: transposase domain-containing protein [Chitinophagaceae bacterium]|nr:transposase domain-containing protein [Chitinophagaceae bacterium]
MKIPSIREKCLILKRTQKGKPSHGIEPYAWLKDLLHRIADHPVNKVAELLPHRYKK